MKPLSAALALALLAAGCAPVKDRTQLDKGAGTADRGVYPDWGSTWWDTGAGTHDSGRLTDGKPRADTSSTRDKGASGDKGSSTGCGPNDSECTTSSWPPAACTGGRCYGKGCCCPTERLCASGSFPVCCPAGQKCKGAGQCGP